MSCQRYHQPLSPRKICKALIDRRVAKKRANRGDSDSRGETTLPPPEAMEPESPQEHLDEILKSRGYSSRRFKTTQSSEPTKLQKASYGEHLNQHISNGNVTALHDIMSCGISPNPCRTSGESLVHTICRDGHHESLRVMVECGTRLMVTDGLGRSPLHDACWATEPCFEIVDIIMKNGDVRLFQMTDKRGAPPLSYVPSENWTAWVDWMDVNKDVLWPIQHQQQSENSVEQQVELTATVPDPENALTPEVARLVVTGKMEPEEVRCLQYALDEADDEDHSCNATGDRLVDLYCSGTNVTLDEDELADILMEM